MRLKKEGPPALWPAVALGLFLMISITTPPAYGAGDSGEGCWGDAITPQTFLESFTSALGAPGGVLGIMCPNGERHFFVNGKSNLALGQAMHRLNKFRIGSITKTFTATVVLQLAKEGWFGLDDPIRRYLPARYRQAFDFRGVTIRQLLQHTSGIGSYTAGESYAQLAFTHPLKIYGPFDLVTLGFEDGWQFSPPGSGFYYSNTNYALLALIIEFVTGHDVEDEITSRICLSRKLEPKLHQTSLHKKCPYFLLPVYTLGYSDLNLDGTIEADEDVTPLSPTGPWTAGGMISNASDLLTYFKALTDGSFLNRKYQHERLQYVCKTRDSAGNCTTWYGLGIQLGSIPNPENPNLPLTYLGHDGIINGFYAIGGAVTVDGHKFVLVSLLNIGVPPLEALGPSGTTGALKRDIVYDRFMKALSESRPRHVDQKSKVIVDFFMEAVRTEYPVKFDKKKKTSEQ